MNSELNIDDTKEILKINKEILSFNIDQYLNPLEKCYNYDTMAEDVIFIKNITKEFLAIQFKLKM